MSDDAGRGAPGEPPRAPTDPTRSDASRPGDDPDAATTSTSPPSGPDPEDDLEAYRRRRARRVHVVGRVVAAIALLALLLPTGRWALEELRFRLQEATVVETLEGQRAGDELVDTVMLVRAAGCDPAATTSGSAFVVATDDGPRLVTNRHVVESTRRIGVSTLDADRTWSVVDAEVSDLADVAVLHLEPDAPLPAPLAIADAPAAPGQSVRLVGFPAARPFTTAGEVAEVADRRLLLDLEVDRGASGSPVVDLDGRVVAQVFAVTGDGLGVATPADELQRALGSLQPLAPC